MESSKQGDLTSLAAQALGRKGGKATKERYGNDHFRKLQELSAKVRKENAAKRKNAS